MVHLPVVLGRTETSSLARRTASRDDPWSRLARYLGRALRQQDALIAAIELVTRMVGLRRSKLNRSRLQVSSAGHRREVVDRADATLVALAEERNITRIVTLDNDFHIYRLTGRKRFDLNPA
jgi:hypothetical protein